MSDHPPAARVRLSEDDEDDGYPYDEEEPYEDWEICTACSAHIFSEEHDWDCPYARDDEDEE